jgi:uncharacterized lipoprotein YbaY
MLAITMILQLTIIQAVGEPLPAGSSVRVEARDTSLADAPAVMLKRVDVAVPKAGRTTSVSVPIELPAVPDGTTVWAHVDVDRDGRVSKGDFVTVESYPVKIGSPKMTIRVKKVT